MRVAIFEIEDWEREYLTEKLKDVPVELTFTRDKLALYNVGAFSTYEIMSVFIYSDLSETILNLLPNLKFICTRSTGFDHINIQATKTRNIPVSYVPTYGSETVAEHTLALMLALSRKLPEAVERTKKGSFSLEGLMGFNLKGKVLGIIGLGNIGKRVAELAKSMGMRILIYSKSRHTEEVGQLGAEEVEMDMLLASSDFITLHIPLNNETDHFINSEKIGKMKRGVYLVNTARGGVVDTAALIDGLNKGIIAGAALDVLEEEKLIKEERELISADYPAEQLKRILEGHILSHYPNVIITPHTAFYSKEALVDILNITVDNIKAFVAGAPKNLVV